MAQLSALHKACLDGSLEGVRAALAQPDAPQAVSYTHLTLPTKA